MFRMRSGNRLHGSGLIVLACGAVISALGVSLAGSLLPPGIMVMLLGLVIIVLGAVRELPE